MSNGTGPLPRTVLFVTSSPQVGTVENVPTEFEETMFIKTRPWVEEVAKLSALFLVLYILLLGLSYIPR